MTDARQDAVARAESYFDQGGFQADLAALVAHPTESQNPAQRSHLDRYLTQAMIPRLSGLGFATRVLDNPDPRGGPLLIAERIEDPALTTVLTYGHGDVVRAQTDQWRDGLSPFVLTAEGDRLYGRGAADNKGQHLINLAALQAVIDTRGHLGFNMRIIFEMSEETGSPGLAQVCRDHADALAADVLIASDGPRLQADVPTLFMGSRAALAFDLVLELRSGAHHSGNWGGLLADPAMILAHALATICDRRGQIQIPEWRPDSLTPALRDALRDLPVIEAGGPQVDADWGEVGLTPTERAFGWNSFAVLAMTAGVPDAPVNAIAGRARATCQLRYVVGTDPSDILPALRRHLDRHGHHAVRIVPRDGDPAHATRLMPDHDWVRRVAGSVRRTTGQDPHLLPNLAGSLPNECFAEILGLPTIWVPHSYRGCCQHAPDEHALQGLSRQALAIMAGLWWDLGTPADGT